MKKTERIIAAVLGAIFLAASSILIIAICFTPDRWEGIIMKQGLSHQGIYVMLDGASFFSIYMISLGLICLAMKRITAATYFFLLILTIVWQLILEPTAKYCAGVSEGMAVWFVNLIIMIVVSSPFLIFYWRSKKGTASE